MEAHVPQNVDCFLFISPYYAYQPILIGKDGTSGAFIDTSGELNYLREI